MARLRGVCGPNESNYDRTGAIVTQTASIEPDRGLCDSPGSLYGPIGRHCSLVVLGLLLQEIGALVTQQRSPCDPIGGNFCMMKAFVA